MKETRLTFPEVALIAGTRAVGGAGLGLLLANRLSDSQRRAVGWTLLLVGALTTVPLALEVFGKRRPASSLEADRIDRVLCSEDEVRLDQPSALART